MSRILAGYVIVAGLFPAALASQDLRAMRERIGREAEAARQAGAVVQELRSLERRTRTATDTIVIAGGNITVLSQADVAAVVRAGAMQADSVMRPIAELLAPLRGTIVYAERDTRSVYTNEERPIITLYYSAPPHRNPARMESSIEAEPVARLIEGTAVSRAVAANYADTSKRLPIFMWRRANFPLRKEDRTEPKWGDVRFDILESPSLLGPRCYRGDLVSCSMLLGFTPVDDPVMVWYDSLTRVRTVTDRRHMALRVNRDLTDACEHGNDAACGRVLHQMHLYRDPPAGAVARDALIWEAIRLGGDDALPRLMTHRGPPAEAIAAAAGVPVDSVVKTWQRHVREGALGSDDLGLVLVIGAIGWTALLLFLSTRISRWR
jgi:hypothetical protein